MDFEYDPFSSTAKSSDWKVVKLKKLKQGTTTTVKETRKRPREEAEEPPAPPDPKLAEVTLTGTSVEPFRTFNQLPIIANGTLTQALKNRGFTAPTPIQAYAWPIALAKKDMVGVAKTGSGKTLAFMIPALFHIEHSGGLGAGVLVTVLCPTRELALQILDEVQKILPPAFRIVCIYGGAEKKPQLDLINQGCDIVVGTPGRVIDFLDVKKLDLKKVMYLVLDEADRMLDMGFEPQVRRICQATGPRQTLMFSATWSPEVQRMASSFMTDPARVTIGSTRLTANSDIEQQFIFCADEHTKSAELLRAISRRPATRMIIFVNMKTTADSLDAQLRRSGLDSQALHGDKDQAQREYILKRFKQSKAGILIATDVAARGIDIKGLPLVINYDFPSAVDDYVHRIGRTGRAGEKGTSLTLLLKRDRHLTPVVAQQLVAFLKSADQVIPREIEERALFVSAAPRETRINPNGAIVPYKASTPKVAPKKKLPKGTTFFGVRV
jgi:ATP-dependent RNA helicase DDX5/DBP2